MVMLIKPLCLAFLVLGRLTRQRIIKRAREKQSPVTQKRKMSKKES